MLQNLRYAPYYSIMCQLIMAQLSCFINACSVLFMSVGTTHIGGV